MAWAFLVSSGVVAVAGILALQAGAHGHHAMYAVTAMSFVAAFFLFIPAVNRMDIGIANGVWIALTVALTALGSIVFFGERFSSTVWGGIALITAGVFLIEVGAQ